MKQGSNNISDINGNTSLHTISTSNYGLGNYQNLFPSPPNEQDTQNIQTTTPYVTINNTKYSKMSPNVRSSSNKNNNL